MLRAICSRAKSPLRHARRPFTSSPFFTPPKVTFLRIVLTGGATAAGFISYKVKGLSDWLHESLEDGWSILYLAKRELAGLLGDLEYRRYPGTQVDDSAENAVNNSFTITTPAEHQSQPDFNDFIRKIIEIRDILRTAGSEDAVKLPNIVVIGSQSSGKSSVLEAIVGHEFLPKGQNMVTRRPLELSLIHTAEPREQIVIHGTAHGPNNPLFDFSQAQAVLREMNMAVPAEDWISDEPIAISIYSPKVPDLTLVDLPGYIQVTNRSQPPVLRDKIRALCERYIQRDNLILAVCAADVDLANAEALKASRIHDPLGERTIGVITKLDLVSPDLAAGLIDNKDYPLMLGYVGVVCKAPGTVAGRSSGPQKSTASAEQAYFREHAEAYSKIENRCGFSALRQLMTSSLEAVLAGSMAAAIVRVEEELSELKYQMKVQYNDRFISPEAYLTDIISSLKREFAQICRQFTRSQMQQHLQDAFHQRFLGLCDEFYWSADVADSLPKSYAQVKEFEDNWEHRLQSSVASFTRSGVGRSMANLMAEQIIRAVHSALLHPPFSYHSTLHAQLCTAAETCLKRRSLAAIEQVENSMKPFKHGVEFTPHEWSQATHQLLSVLRATERQWTQDIDAIKEQLGLKRLRRAVEFLLQHQPTDDVTVDLASNPVLLKAQEVVVKSAKLKRLQARLKAITEIKDSEPLAVRDHSIKSSLFHRMSALLGFKLADSFTAASLQYESMPEKEIVVIKDPCQYVLPEVYLYLMMDRFLNTCSTFVHYELVNEFLQPFADDVVSGDSMQSGVLSINRLPPEQLRLLLSENPVIAKHLHMQERYRALEQVLLRFNDLKNHSRQRAGSSKHFSAPQQEPSMTQKFAV